MNLAFENNLLLIKIELKLHYYLIIVIRILYINNIESKLERINLISAQTEDNLNLIIFKSIRIRQKQ